MLQSESTLYSCPNVKELLARTRREIWSLSDCNWTRTHSYLVRKRTLNHFAKMIWRPVRPNGWVFVYKLSGSGFESSCNLEKVLNLISVCARRFPWFVIEIWSLWSKRGSDPSSCEWNHIISRKWIVQFQVAFQGTKEVGFDKMNRFISCWPKIHTVSPVYTTEDMSRSSLQEVFCKKRFFCFQNENRNNERARVGVQMKFPFRIP